MHVVTEVDPETGDAPGAKCLPDRLRRPRGFRRRRPAAQNDHRRPRRIRGPAWIDGWLPRRWRGSVCPAPRARPSIRAPRSRPAFDLEPGAEIQIVFLLGEAEGIDAARDLIRTLSARTEQALACTATTFGHDGMACSKRSRCALPSRRSIS